MHDNLGIAILRELDMAVMERIAPGEYQLYGALPEFYNQLFPADEDGRPCSRPWQFSPMLDFFLEEAENFFSSQQPGSIDSGIWLEELPGQGDLPLLATARQVEGMNIITIQCVRDSYQERARILHQARSELLEMEKISSDLATYKAKSLYDALTKIYNRGTFEEMLKSHVNSRRHSETHNLALLMLDLDHFKQVNDTFGHLAGDSVLSQMGEILREVLRKEDVPTRYGGEEFVVMAPATNLEQARIVGEKIRQAVQNHDFGLKKNITISVGCTVFQPGENLRSLLQRADDALYAAKNNGRNQVCLLEPSGQINI